ncbi:hypothetical protein CAPTEDRAFT_203332 [Capitella teleta]|uniref:G-protein coupled receptors family 1 profile domain-containing protein n=1 Tax=Capitella teleta TaxID=283909 RepID=R7VGE9_CAPTE|nr:hypothetical protein CAPTEDRAFT_203332 [Capitella teleta]|eukprot:ELU15391.1 hypothetical protein CAPTEDRAFT_203332 [Capitella teleta]
MDSTTDSSGPTDAGAEDANREACMMYYLLFGSCLGGSILIFGVLGNIVTIIIMSRERKKSSSIYSLLMLAITDLFVLLAYSYLPVIGFRKYFFGWWAGHNFNHIATLYIKEAARVFNQISAFITMIVAMQRYISVCVPHRAKTMCTVRLVQILTCTSYISSFVFYLPNFFLYSLKQNEQGRYYTVSHPIISDPAFQWVYMTVLTMSISYIIPVSILLFMAVNIMRSLRQQSRAMNSHSDERTKAAKGLTITSVAIVLMFVVCQSFTSATRILMWIFDPYLDYSRCGGHLQFYAFVPHVALMFNSAINFLCYILFAKTFRRKLVALFRRTNAVDDVTSALNYQQAKAQNKRISTVIVDHK